MCYDGGGSDLYARCMASGSFQGLTAVEYRALRDYQAFCRRFWYVEPSTRSKHGSEKWLKDMDAFVKMELPGGPRLVVSSVRPPSLITDEPA